MFLLATCFLIFYCNILILVPEVAPNVTTTSNTKTFNISWTYTKDIFLWNAWQLQQFYLHLSPIFLHLVDVSRNLTYLVDDLVFNLETDIVDYFSLYYLDIGGVTLNGLGVVKRYCLATSQYCK